MTSRLPPFSSVLKSRDVEDPVNLWLHRPLAYAIVAALYQTPVTPNQITLASMIIGIAAGVCWLVGGPWLVILGGALLWASSILDGADGILARAKQIQSDVGRALDGTADAVVAAVTVFAAFVHIWREHQQLLHLPLMFIALTTAVVQIYLYDYYKEIYLRATTPGRSAGRETPETVALRRDRCDFAVTRFALNSHLTILTAQLRLARLTNPTSLGLDPSPVTAASARLFRRYNYMPMQLWALISLCPHTYLIALAAIFQRLDLYLWFRVFGGNAIFLVALVWQKLATARTIGALEALSRREEARSRR